MVIVPSAARTKYRQLGAARALAALVIPRDRSHRVDICGERVGSTWTIERGDGAVRRPHKAVHRTTRVGVIPGEGRRRVNAARLRALIQARAGPRNIERGKDGRLRAGQNVGANNGRSDCFFIFNCPSNKLKPEDFAQVAHTRGAGS